MRTMRAVGGVTGRRDDMPSPRIALAMIVRDEERSLGRALSSAHALVDDIIVADTGSLDGTVEVARAHGARIAHVAWSDDFAAARNHALGQTDADVVFMMDADEWVEPGDPDVLRRWASTAGAGAAGQVTVISESESDDATLTTEARIVRVLPRGSRFVGRIHEQATGYSSLTTVPGVRLLHDGYRTPQLDRKRGRNERILQQLLAGTPDDPYLLFQLGRERQIAGAFGDAADAYLRALPHVDDHTPWRDDVRARLIVSLHRAGRVDDALATTTDLLGRTPSAEVLFAAGNLFLDLAVASPARRTTFVPMARSAWRACLAIGEPRDGRDTTPGCGSYLAADNLAALCEAQGDETGRRHWRDLAATLRRDAGVDHGVVAH